MIYEQRFYVNDDGVTIRERTPWNADTIVGVKYDTIVTAEFTMLMPNGQPGVVKGPLTFDIPADNVQAAFDAFLECLKEARIKKVEELKKNAKAMKEQQLRDILTN